MKKADITGGNIYLIFVIMAGLIGVAVVIMRLSPLDSPEARALELATSIGLYVDSLTTAESGLITLDLSEYEYDIKIEKWDSALRSIGDALPYVKKYISKNGFYVTVTPYIEVEKNGAKTEEKGEKASFIITSYGLDTDCDRMNLGRDCSLTLLSANKVCISKEPGKEFAEVKKC